MRKTYYLVIFGMCLLTFSRILEVIFGFPKIINLLHFPFFAALFLFTLDKERLRKDPLIMGIGLLFAVILFSGAINSAGLVNMILDFVLVSEPFMLLAIIVNIEYSEKMISRFGKFLLGIGLVHVPFVIYQWIAQLNMPDTDSIKGVFLEMGAGHHVLGGVALICAIYILFSFKSNPKWIRYALAAPLLLIIFISDAKQVIIAFFAAYFALNIIKMRSSRKHLKRAIVVMGVIGCLLLLGITLCNSNACYGGNKRIVLGLKTKATIFSVIDSYHDSNADWLFGAGPGHSVGRFAVLMPKYWDMISPFGATTSPLTQLGMDAWFSNWASKSSSFFSTGFSWSGILGDIGIIGFLVYAYLFLVVYRKFCKDDISKLFLLFMVVLGMIFQWLEEPNFALYGMAVIGQRWVLWKKCAKE